MSAELLREAASLMRERAGRATSGPWQVGQDVDSGERFIYDARWTELAQVAEWSTGLGNPDHIASRHPAVALDVADLLEEVAGWREEGLGLMPNSNLADAWGCVERQAKVIVRTYLGRDA